MRTVPQKLGLILTGGGSRAAYQVGVLKAMAELLPRHAKNPFPVICGTSAGSLNAMTLAVNADSFRKGVQFLMSIWRSSQTDQVYRTDWPGVLKNTGLWLAGVIFSGIGRSRFSRISLLDNSPLAKLLRDTLPVGKLQEHIAGGLIHALSVTASGYASGHSVTFYQGVKSIRPWVRARRVGIPTRIDTRHLLASSAIPFLFPAVRINREYFGDGSMRQIAPISDALHLGATRILIIGVGQCKDTNTKRSNTVSDPSIAQIAGHLMNSIFLDSLEVDIERLHRVNRTVIHLSEEAKKASGMRHVDSLVIEPSQPIDKIAERFAKNLPRSIRFLLRFIGGMRASGANLVSYLLFEQDFCNAMIELGYQDALSRKDEILAFIQHTEESTVPAKVGDKHFV